MFFRPLRLVVPGFILLLAALVGCSLPMETIEPAPAPTYEAPITLAYPEPPIELSLVSELPGMIRLIGYSDSYFVTGTVGVSEDDWIPETETGYSKVTLAQRAKTKIVSSQGLINLWRLRVSDQEPFRLEIRNEQAEGHWNLSGLPITDLYAELGAAKNAFTFDQPNPAVMRIGELRCGTGDVIAEGILNAVCQKMVVEAGKGNITLRFSGGGIWQNLQVGIRAGTGTINIAIAAEIPARIIVTSRGQVIQGEGIKKLAGCDSDLYETASYQGATDKTVEIVISGGSGTIYLNPLPS